ncbi:MAG: PaaI family thioesterase [Minwuia sp.]|uniref:PaaI family thioesterase n=1 Tax=Minwuia sp. TaxID=2493630 RepID=UPI003A8AA966
MAERPSEISLEAAREGASSWFAPWVKDLGIEIEDIARGRVTARVPKNDRLTRIGGIMSGQAMMAVADTVMVFAIRSCLSDGQDIATVQQSTSFFRAVADADLICEVTITKEGRTMMFGDCVMYADGQREKPAAQATVVYAVIPKR